MFVSRALSPSFARLTASIAFRLHAVLANAAKAATVARLFALFIIGSSPGVWAYSLGRRGFATKGRPSERRAVYGKAARFGATKRSAAGVSSGRSCVARLD